MFYIFILSQLGDTKIITKTSNRHKTRSNRFNHVKCNCPANIQCTLIIYYIDTVSCNFKVA